MPAPNFTSSIPGLYEEQLTIKFRLFERYSHALAAYSGVSFEQIRFEDSQDVPNKIEADFGPMFVFGLEYKF